MSGRTPTGLVFADNFNDSGSPLTGQTADTGQTWQAWDWPNWPVGNSLQVATAYGTEGTNGAGGPSPVGPGRGNMVLLGETLSGGPIRLEFDFRDDTGGNYPVIYLRDPVAGMAASLNWFKGDLGFEGLGLSALYLDPGIASGVLHGILDIDLDNKSVEFSWYDPTNRNDPTRSGFAYVGSYTVDFAPDRLQLWTYNYVSGNAGIDNIELFQIPEPGSLTLLALGLGLLALCGRRRK